MIPLTVARRMALGSRKPLVKVKMQNLCACPLPRNFLQKQERHHHQCGRTRSQQYGSILSGAKGCPRVSATLIFLTTVCVARSTTETSLEGSVGKPRAHELDYLITPAFGGLR